VLARELGCWTTQSSLRDQDVVLSRAIKRASRQVLNERHLFIYQFIFQLVRLKCQRPSVAERHGQDNGEAEIEADRQDHFYPRDAMLARVIEIATCLSVCPSVCLSVRHAPVLCQNEES